uniref:Malate dehydrogenase n=1 Tax=Mantoniella antarctica TaxID=81844 RepID=A0A7S0SSH8_9CHLO|mmetsp:Transcript_33874/g.85269  ORF Transcript_33874/g.85269 Transcript_33874/m.85269 type:complete len:336 (+) Transcript_33874:327-1334(+)|eukprot:CAMPEP_0181359534 /NCGR_PEP_ID=MMETSP1106-20121128/6143_1 /TAXON_ID=81844 /ORGANISM="Mantoniella antarctica, Strain SL-175" /LENGTH=335 /DNA_ID=CAMNT_0023472665 /DNA_START=73 /DNA_END=1080 /DNA_ORIENTATION=+
MFASASRAVGQSLMKSQQSRGYKVAVLGAAGGIGQPCGLLMKMNPLVTELSLYDIAGTPGVAADISHINTAAQTKGFAGDAELGAALTGCDVVIIPAGVPRKPGMTRDDLFKINAGIVAGLTSAIAEHCPGAIINMISNPVNSTVPIAAEVLKKKGVYDPKKLFGVTTLDVVRSKTFYAEKFGLETSKVDVPVIGGHAGITILPLLSQATPKAEGMTPEVIDALTKRIQDGGTEVVAAKAGKGSATLSMAYAGALFADACLRAKNGENGVVECTYVESTVTESRFFASKVTLGKNGVDTIHGLGDITPYEQKALDGMMDELKDSIAKGVEFAKAL